MATKRFDDVAEKARALEAQAMYESCPELGDMRMRP